MGLSVLENLLWALGTALKVLVCFLVYYRHVHKRLPFFSIYVALLVAEVVVVWSVYRVWGFTSRLAWYTAWSGIGILLLARTLVVAELCWTSLRMYPAVWSLTRKLLLFVAIVVIGYAAVAAYQNKSPLAAFVLTAESGSEISFLVVLVALVAFGIRYDVGLGPVERNIALGLGIYSAFQVFNDSFMEQWMTLHFHWWNSTRVVSFDVALVAWLVPLRKALPPRDEPPVLLSDVVARRLLREVLDRMREVTDELKRLGKLPRK